MSIRARVALTTAVAATLIVALATLIVTELATADRRRDLDAQLGREASLVGALLASSAFNEGIVGFDGGLTRRSIRLLDGGGALLFEVGTVLPNVNVLTTPVPGAVTVQTAADGNWRMVTLRTDPGARLGDAAQSDDAVPAFVQIAAPVTEIDAQVAAIRRGALRVGGLAVVGAALLGFVFGGLALRPLSRLRRAAELVAASGDPATRVDTRALPRELAELADRMNAMLGRLADAQAEQGRTLMASRSFAADAAHELRTPLASMSANLERLDAAPAGHAPVGDADRAALTDAITELHRMANIVDALHALASAELAPARSDRVDLADLIEVAATRARRRYDRLTVLVELPEHDVEVLGGNESLGLVLDNLFANSALHAGSGTEPVTVGVQVRPDRRDGWWRITIDDDGRGVPAGDRDRVLRRFQRGNTASGGTGLGLSIVTEQIRRHGGTLHLDQAPTGGLRVVITLPDAPPSPAPAPGSSPTRRDPDGPRSPPK